MSETKDSESDESITQFSLSVLFFYDHLSVTFARVEATTLLGCVVGKDNFTHACIFLSFSQSSKSHDTTGPTFIIMMISDHALLDLLFGYPH